MTFAAILALSVGLAMDATAVSAARGLAVPKIRARHVLLVALFFGGFQALMPLVLSLVTIGVTTAALSGVGLYAGKRFGPLLGKRLDVVGGLVLIGLGTKTLAEHLMAP